MDSSPTALFDSYEQDFQQILQSIRDKLDGDAADARGGEPEPAFLVGCLVRPQRMLTPPSRPPPRAEQKKAALRRVEMELDEADEMVRPAPLPPSLRALTHPPRPQISQMEIEINGIPQSLKAAYQARTRTAKADLARAKKRSKDAHTHLARSDLLSRSSSSNPNGATSDEPYGADGVGGDRTRLLAGTALLDDGTRRLQESQRIALETEEQGAGILRSLRGQREQIENARDTVRPPPSLLIFLPCGAC